MNAPHGVFGPLEEEDGTVGVVEEADGPVRVVCPKAHGIKHMAKRSTAQMGGRRLTVYDKEGLIL